VQPRYSRIPVVHAGGPLWAGVTWRFGISEVFDPSSAAVHSETLESMPEHLRNHTEGMVKQVQAGQRDVFC
jgi:hypothetical protein